LFSSGAQEVVSPKKKIGYGKEISWARGKKKGSKESAKMAGGCWD